MTREQIVKDALRYVDKHTPSIVHLSGQCIRTLHGHESGVKCLDFFGHILVSGDTLGFLKIWHVQSGNLNIDTRERIQGI